jgi:hypothetical protein
VGYGGAEQHLANDQAAKHIITPGETSGLQACLPIGVGGGDPAADAEKKSKSHSLVELEQIELQGARSTGATSGGDGDERRRDRQIAMVS